MPTKKVVSFAQMGLIVAFSVTGFGWVATPQPTGFISDDSRLERVGLGNLPYLVNDSATYHRYIVDPVQTGVHQDPPALTPEEQADFANYFHDAISRVSGERGNKIVTTAGVQSPPVRLAITDIHKSNWYLNLYPPMKLSSAFTGGASLECEVIDSVTGSQLAATIQAGRSIQIQHGTCNSLDNVHDAMDRWARVAGKRIDEWRRNHCESIT